MGQSPPGDSYNFDGIGLPLLNGPTEFGPVHPKERQWTKTPTKLCKPGDILFCVRGATAGRTNVADKEYCLGRGLAAIRAKSGRFDNRFLHYVLSAGYSRFQAQGVGSTFINISGELLSSFDVPLLPFDEQRRVAVVLDQADDLRRKRREALTRTERLAQSYFVELFGDPLTNPKRWPERMVLGQVAEIVSGVTKGRKLNGAPTRSVPYLAVANVQDKALVLDRIKWIDATEAEIRRFRLLRNDLLLTEGGDPDKLGRGTLWNEEIDECIHQNHVFRVRLTSPDLLPVFLNWLVGSERGKRYFLGAAKQTTGIASINMGQLRQFPLLIPAIEVQHAFASRVAEIDKLTAHHRTHLAKLDALFASLQHRAFRGEL
jgi:type I restriction enzyme, S subunit